jgi:hypothetical protein
MLWRRIASGLTLIPITIAFCILLIFYVDKTIEDLHRRIMKRKPRGARKPRLAFKGRRDAPESILGRTEPLVGQAEPLERPEQSQPPSGRF